jgi:hypothetical protein
VKTCAHVDRTDQWESIPDDKAVHAWLYAAGIFSATPRK